jgi:glycine cleavage system transcriptional repressor
MMKHRFFALSVLGKDRPGIVAGITKVLYELGANLEDSSMTTLRNEFAMLLIIKVPNLVSSEKLSEKFRAMDSKFGLSILIKQLDRSEIKMTKPGVKPYVITVYGADKPGIVFNITKHLAKMKISITDVQTNVIKPGSKKPAYILILEIDIPKTVSVNKIHASLKKEASRLGVQFSIQNAETAEL